MPVPNANRNRVDKLTDKSAFSGLSIICINAWSLVNKFSLFELFLWKLNSKGVVPDIIAVSETFFTNQLYMSLYDLPEYNAIHFYRPSERRGGGVSLYIKRSLQIHPNIIKKNCNDVQFLLVNLKNIDVNVCVTYRPPSSIFF